MAVSALGAPFMLYLALICMVGSETLYIEPHSRLFTTIALFLAAAFYAGLYYCLAVSRKDESTRADQLTRWVS
jgi:hypothetical protein